MISSIILLIMMNSYRMDPLVIDNSLSEKAYERAIIVSNNWSHDGWVYSFFGTNCKKMGENLARDFTSTEYMFNAWMNSPSHRKNILNESFNKVGIGTYKNITVELFCEN